MWHPRGYGGYSVGEAARLQNWDEALVTVWNHDNAGPMSKEAYVSAFEAIQKEFPNATVFASSFDGWLAALEASGQADTLPTLSQEIGDSWIYGVPSDPKKVAMSRAYDRALEAYVGGGGAHDDVLLNFTRLVVNNPEHTWGIDVKSHLFDNANWTNAQFDAARKWYHSMQPGRQYDQLEASWWEQRKWTEYPRRALPAQHPLTKLVDAEVSQLGEAVPFDALRDGGALKAAGFAPLADAASPTRAARRCSPSTTRGAVAAVHDASDLRHKGPLLCALYRVPAAELSTFQENYANESKPPDWFRHDFGKPNETVSENVTLYSARTSPVYVKQDDASGTTTVMVRMAIASRGYEPSKVYGAPAAIVLRLVVQHTASDDAAAPPRVAATVWLVNKTATRMPESTFLAFHPDGAAARWEISKLGSWEAPVPGWVVAGGSKHLHAVSPTVAARASRRRRRASCSPLRWSTPRSSTSVRPTPSRCPP